MKAIFCLGLISASLMACSSGDDDKKFEDNVTYDYDTKSCVYNFNQGSSARLEKMSQVRIETTVFNKEFNIALFEGVASASVAESMNFISQTNVSIYKTDGIRTNQCERNLFETAKDMPSDLKDKWNSVGDQGVMAIYLPKGERGLPTNYDKAAIIIRQNTNRWTLVHEFMHHLFELKSSEAGVDTNQLKDDFNRQMNRLTEISKSSKPDSEIIMDMAPVAKQLFEAFDALMVHFTLEEMAIESFMKKQKSKGVLQYVPESSNWYINESAKKAIEAYEGQKNLVSAIRSQAAISKGAEGVYDQMSVLLDRIQNRISEINGIKREYPDYSLSLKLSDAVGLTLNSQPDTHEAPCAHDKEMEEVFESLKSLN